MRAEDALRLGDAGQFFPEEIIILKRGRFYRSIREEFFNWDWIFLKDGREIIADVSPLHFSQNFSRIDVRTGKTMDSFAIPAESGEPPDWVRALQAHEAAGISPTPPPTRDCRFRLSSRTRSETR